MANRNQDYSSQSGSRGQSRDWREDDDNSYDDGRVQYGRWRERDTDEQSGSTGRYAGYGDFGRGQYGGGRSGWSGQERHGQSGYGQGGYSSQAGYGRAGQGDYRRSGQGNTGAYGYGVGYGGGDRDRNRYGESNYRSEYGYGSSRGWNEPYGEGQQYTSGGNYAGRGADEWGSSQGWGSYGSDSRGYGFGTQGMGEHRGKGPKGYQRSDERIKELVSERLREDPHIDPSEVTINVQGGKITLEGSVDSRHTKNAIEEIAEQFGSQDVQNNLRVQRNQGESQGRQSRGAGSEESSSTRQKH